MGMAWAWRGRGVGVAWARRGCGRGGRGDRGGRGKCMCMYACIHALRRCEMLTATTPGLRAEAAIWKPLEGTPETTMSALA